MEHTSAGLSDLVCCEHFYILSTRDEACHAPAAFRLTSPGQAPQALISVVVQGSGSNWFGLGCPGHCTGSLSWSVQPSQVPLALFQATPCPEPENFTHHSRFRSSPVRDRPRYSNSRPCMSSCAVQLPTRVTPRLPARLKVFTLREHGFPSAHSLQGIMAPSPLHSLTGRQT